LNDDGDGCEAGTVCGVRGGIALEAERGFETGFDGGVALDASVGDTEGIARLIGTIAVFSDGWMASLLIVYIEYITNNSMIIIKNAVVIRMR